MAKRGPSRPVPAVFILYGRRSARDVLFDDLLAREHLAAVKARLCCPDAAPAEYDASEADLAHILDEVQTPAMWGEPRIVVLRSAELVLNPPADSRSRLEALVDRIHAIASSDSPPGHLVLVAAALEMKGKEPTSRFAPAAALISQVRASGGLLSCVPPYESGLRGDLSRRARSVGVTLASGAAEVLIRTVGTDHLALQEELDKLIASIAPETLITPAHVESLASDRPVATAFDLADSILDGDFPASLANLRDLRSVPATRSSGFLLPSIAASFRRFLAAARAVEKGSSPSEAASGAGVHSYFQPVFLARLAKWDAPALKALLRRALQCDVQIKSGSVLENVAIETFVSDACARRFHSPELVGRWIHEI